MDKNAIKKYAVWARNELITRVTQKAEQYEITEKKIAPKDVDSINGRLLTDAEKNQRKALIEKIQTDGFEQVMEEVAYTWFNRFTALRFMEVNNYLPSHTRVFTNEAGEFKPQILADAIQLSLEGLDMDKVFELKDANKTEELYKYLLITQCNALSAVLPRMFQKIEHYTELLLPDYLLREGSVIEQMITLIPEEDWTDQVQIIGWLYQYYNSEPKDAVFAALKKNVKISKENIPAATQLFTPDWIVRYMVENSLGRLWLEGHPNDNLKSEWKYYLDEAEQKVDVQKQMDIIRTEYANLKPEDIRCIDPCMGSGHILCYMFDILVKIYEDYGYTEREAARNIVEKNLWGLDIDERAAQLSYFTVMMKARQYDRRFFSKEVQPNIYVIKESNGVDLHCVDFFVDGRDILKASIETLIAEMHDAKEYGSLIDITLTNFDDLYTRFDEIKHEESPSIYSYQAIDELLPLVQVAHALAQKYHVVVTNPPYMNIGNMGAKLSSFIKKNYKDSKFDIFAAFMEKCMSLAEKNSFVSMITQQVWMFISSFEKLRKKVYAKDISSLVYVGYNSFPELNSKVALGTTFVWRNSQVRGFKGTYYDLNRKVSKSADKQKVFEEQLGTASVYTICSDEFEIIPGQPVAFWVSEEFRNKFRTQELLLDIADVKNGLGTMDNNRFLRLWYEVNVNNIGFGAIDKDDFLTLDKKWAPYNKAGEARAWYGNRDYVVNWKNDGEEIRELAKNATGGRIVSEEFYFHQSISWSYISYKFAVRFFPTGTMFDSIGTSCFPHDGNYYALLGLLNSKVIAEYLELLAPTLAFNPGSVGKLPISFGTKKDEIEKLAKRCVEITKEDWDWNETSWDFKRHPFIGKFNSIEEAYTQWSLECSERVRELQRSQDEIDMICSQIYEVPIDETIEGKDIFVKKADKSRDVKSFISYAVGCMFGRYSLDVPGLVFAGGEWDMHNYMTFQPDKDAIIPICDDDYFEDDVVGRFVNFVEVVYGKESLEENLQFIADALDGKGSAREVIRAYFISGFYADHCAMYSVTGSGKRPIYWLFDSGKKNGFKCLVYMHRYQPDTIARIRTDYVHEQQSRYRTAIVDLENRINGAGTSDRVKLNKQLAILQAQATEIREYEEKIHHLADQMISIDLDDGVKSNYEIFKDVLAKIK